VLLEKQSNEQFTVGRVRAGDGQSAATRLLEYPGVVAFGAKPVGRLTEAWLELDETHSLSFFPVQGHGSAALLSGRNRLHFETTHFRSSYDIVYCRCLNASRLQTGGAVT